jgi:hypothetical protein
MSVPSDPIQIGGVNLAAPAVSVAHGAGGVAGGPGGVLAFTGAGPGTLPLAIAGLVSALVGGLLVLFGRDKSGTRTSPDNGLADLSALVD